MQLSYLLLMNPDAQKEVNSVRVENVDSIFAGTTVRLLHLLTMRLLSASASAIM